MIRKPETISEIEIDAYLNDQLDLTGRIMVEEALARDPALAAQVMADLRIRDALRAAMLREAPVSSPRIDFAARRLGNGLTIGRARRAFRQAALAAACIALGWLVHWQVDSVGIPSTEAAALPVRFAAEAVQAHRTALLRAAMISQLEAPEFDRQEILRNTAIALPVFPVDWKVLDVQVFPSTAGSSVVVIFETPRQGPLSLYMVRSGAARSMPLRMSRQGDQQVAYWREGQIGVAVTGHVAPAALRDIAVSLSGGQRASGG